MEPSTQVPGRMVHLPDGPSRTHQIGKTELGFERTTLKEANFKPRESGLLVQALPSLGKERIDEGVIAVTRVWLPVRLRTKTKWANGGCTKRLLGLRRRRRVIVWRGGRMEVNGCADESALVRGQPGAWASIMGFIHGTHVARQKQDEDLAAGGHTPQRR